MKRLANIMWGFAEGIVLGAGISFGTVLILFFIGHITLQDGESMRYLSSFGRYILVVLNIFIASGAAVVIMLYHKNIFPVLGAVCAWKIVWFGLDYLDVNLLGADVVTGGRIGPEAGVIFTGMIISVILLYGMLFRGKKCKG